MAGLLEQEVGWVASWASACVVVIPNHNACHTETEFRIRSFPGSVRAIVDDHPVTQSYRLARGLSQASQRKSGGAAGEGVTRSVTAGLVRRSLGWGAVTKFWRAIGGEEK